MKTKLILADIPRYASDDGETVALSDSLQIRIRAEHDLDHGAPWEDCDGHGPVSEWTTRDKRSGERVLSTDRRSKRFYDFAGAIALAKRDRWGLRDADKAALAAKLGRAPTANEICAEAVERDFKHLQDWCEDRWQYLSVTVTLESLYDDGNAKGIAGDAICGVESDGNYWREIALEMANGVIAAHVTEQAERAHWEARNLVTA